MGKAGQLFTYTELKSLNAKQGAKLKKDLARIIAAETDKDISRVIVVVRTKAGKQRKKPGGG